MNTQKMQCQINSQQPNILQASENIITTCNTSLSSFNFRSTSLSPTFRKKSQLPSYVFDPRQLNFKDKQIQDRCLKKLKQNSKQSKKAPFIRKSQLVETQIIFTKDEQLKLQVIDQFLDRGFDLPTDPLAMQLYPKGPQFTQKGIKQSEIINRNKRQIGEFHEWGDQGNRQNIIDVLNERAQQQIMNIDMKELQKTKYSRKKQMKLVNFVKSKSKSSCKQNRQKKQRISLCIQQNKSINTINSLNIVSKIMNKPTISPGILSQFNIQKYLQIAEAKKFPQLIPENKKMKLGNTLFRKMQQRQRVTRLTAQVSTKYQKTKMSGFMTPVRLQALYDCEIMKGAKHIQPKKDYFDLEYVFKKVMSKAERKKTKQGQNRQSQTSHFSNENGKKQQEIDKVIAKNKQRLRSERQKIIQKLRC